MTLLTDAVRQLILATLDGAAALLVRRMLIVERDCIGLGRAVIDRRFRERRFGSDGERKMKLDQSRAGGSRDGPPPC